MTSLLILIPTRLELQVLRPLLEPHFSDGNSRFELCGFGLVAAAARSALLIERLAPRGVLLIGIAGSLNGQLEIGTASRFSKVICDGIGAGTGRNFHSADELGWKHWEDEGDCGEPPDARWTPGIRDLISFAGLRSEASEGALSKTADIQSSGDLLLLSVCAASASKDEADERCRRFPTARAEDMEGFAVAAACAMAGVPLDIVRGISNRAGDRDKSRWRIHDALSAAAELARGLRIED